MRINAILTIFALFISFIRADYQITSPTAGSKYPAYTIITFTANEFSDTVSIDCFNPESGLSYNNSETSVPADTPAYFQLDNLYIGPCEITATNRAGSIAQVSFSIVYSVVFEVPVSNPQVNVNAGSSTLLQYTVIPSYFDPLELNVLLVPEAGDLRPQSQLVSNDEAVFFYVPATFYGLCDFTISDLTGNFLPSNPPTIQVNENPIVVSPQENSAWIYPAPILLRLDLRSTTSDQIRFAGSLMCINPGAEEVLGTYNSNNYLYAPIDFVGACHMAISSSDPSIQTVYISFTRYNDAKFVISPATLISKFPFNIMFTASIDPYLGYTLVLSCPTYGINETWPNLISNTLYTFTAPENTTGTTSCTFSIVNGAFPKTVPFITDESPFGSTMYPITNEEEIQFAKSIAIPPSLLIQ